MASKLRLIQFVGVILCLPALIFSERVPVAVVILSAAGLAFLPLLGWLTVQRPLVRTPVDLSISILLILTPLSFLVAVDLPETLPQIYKMLAGAAIFYGLVGLLAERPNVLNPLPWALCLAACLVTFFALAGTDWSASGILDGVPGLAQFRLRPFWKEEGHLGFNVNLAGGTLAMLLPVVLAHTCWGIKLKPRCGAAVSTGVKAILVLLCLLMGLVLLLTRSWGAMAALTCAVVAMLLVWNWRWSSLVLAIAGGVAVLVLLSGRFPLPSLFTTSAADVLNSAEGRLELWSRAMYIMQDFPFTGIGMGSVRTVLPLLYPTFRIPPTADIEHLHNLYFNTGAEMGVLGLVALSALLIGLLALSIEAVRGGKQSAHFPLSLGLFGMQVAYCVHGLTEAISYSPKAHLIAWALFGIAVAVDVRCLQDGLAHGADT